MKSQFNGKVPTLERLQYLLSYDPETGIFKRRVTVSGNAKAGMACGSVSKSGYVYIGVDGVSYKAHRLAWLIMTGDWPAHVIDHRDGDPLNNSWSNLREATVKENTANARRRKDNKTGFKGVRRMNSKWQVRFGKGGRINVGTFDTIEEARLAYERAASAEYGEFSRTA